MFSSKPRVLLGRARTEWCCCGEPVSSTSFPQTPFWGSQDPNTPPSYIPAQDHDVGGSNGATGGWRLAPVPPSACAWLRLLLAGRRHFCPHCSQRQRCPGPSPRGPCPPALPRALLLGSHLSPCHSQSVPASHQPITEHPSLASSLGLVPDHTLFRPSRPHRPVTLRLSSVPSCPHPLPV